MKITIEFSTDNAAFDIEPLDQVYDLMCDVTRKVSRGETGDNIKDYNGGNIGEWSVEE